MSSWTLASCLAPQIEKFIALRTLAGSDYSSQATMLNYFDRFLVEQAVRQPRITREICVLYQEGLFRLAPRTRANRMCVVRQLCEYVARTDPLSYIPEPLRSSSSRGAHRPYIFAQEEVRALLVAATHLPPPESLRPHTYRTLFGVLYSTGIRIGEAMALNIENFFAAEQRLYIAEGKFRKARWIALSASTTRALEQYTARRMDKQPHAPDSPLFLNERRQRLCLPTVHGTFHGMLDACGIGYHKHTGPRVHDLRHTFAVHRLLAWYREGEDVNARLPALATYLGHADIKDTQIYLQPTSALLGEVKRRFHNHYINHLATKGDRS